MSRRQRHDIGRQKSERVRKLRPPRKNRKRSTNDADRLANRLANQVDTLAQELVTPQTTAPPSWRRGTTNRPPIAGS